MARAMTPRGAGGGDGGADLARRVEEAAGAAVLDELDRGQQALAADLADVAVAAHRPYRAARKQAPVSAALATRVEEGFAIPEGELVVGQHVIGRFVMRARVRTVRTSVIWLIVFVFCVRCLPPFNEG